MRGQRFAALLLALAATQASYAGRLVNNTPAFVSTAPDLGAVDPTTVIAVTAWLEIHNKASLDALVKRQNTPGSPNYHAWLTQAQIDATYSPKPQESQAVQNFLTAHNLTVLAVAENNLYVKAQGTVADIQKTFHVQLNNYKVNGVTHRANSTDPSVDPSGGLIAAVTGLDDVEFQPHNVRQTEPDGTPAPVVPLINSADGLFFEGHCLRGVETHSFSGGGHTVTYTGTRFGADITNTTLGHLPSCGFQPSEVRAAYNMNALYTNGLTGEGQTVVIVDAFGSPTIQTDAEVFSQVYGLPDLTPANFQVLSAPGTVQHPDTKRFGSVASWADEITLDVEWVHAMAPGANIALVVSPNNGSDLDEAINWAMVHHLGNTISNSWGGPEGFGNPQTLARVERILEMAAAQGIDVNFSSGDFGDNVQTVGFKTTDYPASSAFATGIGGTSLFVNADGSTLQTGWGTNLTRLTNTDGTPVVPPLNTPPLGFQFGAGGGASLTFAKPAFQAALPGGVRLVPDIAFLADPETGVEIIQTVNGQLSVGVIGGTSLACPMFSALMSIAAQKAGHGLGQAAPLLYSLPAGAVTDIVPQALPSNVTGVIDGKPISADALAAPLDGTTVYISVLFQSPISHRWDVFTFGTDTSLATAVGWDNVTGVGTPNGPAFVEAIVP